LQVRPPGALPQAAQQHRHIRPLPAAIDVQLVHSEELQLTRRLADQCPLLRPDQHVFEHDVIGKQDMRRILEQLLAYLPAGLAGVLREAYRAGGPVLGAEVIERVDLAVDQRVHWIDDQCPHAVARRVVAQDGVENRYQIGQALPRSGAGRDNVVLAATRRRQRFRLVPMQPQARSEEPSRVGGNGTARCEFS
jgi:hypothetical protein